MPTKGSGRDDIFPKHLVSSLRSDIVSRVEDDKGKKFLLPRFSVKLPRFKEAPDFDWSGEFSKEKHSIKWTKRN